MFRACSLISVILADYVSSLESIPEHTTKQQVATVLFVVFNVLLVGVFTSRGMKPMLSAARQLYDKLNPTDHAPPSELRNTLESLSGLLLESLELENETYETPRQARCTGIELAIDPPRGRVRTVFMDASGELPEIDLGR